MRITSQSIDRNKNMAVEGHSRPQSPSFLGHVVGKRGRLQIKSSGSGDGMVEGGTVSHYYILVIRKLLILCRFSDIVCGFLFLLNNFPLQSLEYVACVSGVDRRLGICNI